LKDQLQTGSTYRKSWLQRNSGLSKLAKAREKDRTRNIAAQNVVLIATFFSLATKGVNFYSYFTTKNYPIKT